MPPSSPSSTGNTVTTAAVALGLTAAAVLFTRRRRRRPKDDETHIETFSTETAVAKTTKTTAVTTAKSLDDIAHVYNNVTDNIRSTDTYTGGDKRDRQFCQFYEKLLGPYRNRPNNAVRFLELGVWYGKSLAMWADWFQKDTIIYGIDIHLDRFKEHRPALEAAGAFQRCPVQVLEFDTFSGEFRDWISSQQVPMDIVLDDGNHTAASQYHLFELIFPLLAPGGIYIIEDIVEPWDFFFKGASEESNMLSGFAIVFATLANPKVLHGKAIQKRWLQGMRAAEKFELLQAEGRLKELERQLSLAQDKNGLEQSSKLRQLVEQKQAEIRDTKTRGKNRQKKEQHWLEHLEHQTQSLLGLIQFIDHVEIGGHVVAFHKR